MHITAVGNILVLLLPGPYKTPGPYTFLGMTRWITPSSPLPSLLMVSRFLRSEGIFRHEPFGVSLSLNSS